jgi:hypothetical protein
MPLPAARPPSMRLSILRWVLRWGLTGDRWGAYKCNTGCGWYPPGQFNEIYHGCPPPPPTLKEGGPRTPRKLRNVNCEPSRTGKASRKALLPRLCDPEAILLFLAAARTPPLIYVLASRNTLIAVVTGPPVRPEAVR